MISFYRLDYASDAAFGAWMKEQTIPAAPHELALKVRRGDFVLAARFNENTRLGEVCGVGRVGSPGNRYVQWVAADFVLRPSTQGQRFWKREHFRFADVVATRYLLEATCTELFEGEAMPLLAPQEVPKSGGLGRTRAGGSLSSVRPGQIQEGYVYVIRSDYGYKIGKTKHLRDRTRLFGVKLPFPISLEMSGWFADYSKAERAFHAIYHAKRLEGEWFDLDPNDLAQLRGQLGATSGGGRAAILPA